MTNDLDLIAEALPAYEVGEELGRGAWGVVISGQHRQLRRQVAIKQLPRSFGADPGVRARFLAEAQLLASLNHPHIVPIYDYIEHEGLCLLVMERLTGGTVANRFQTRGFSGPEACALVVAACAGLQYAHTKGVLHRDVKPENLVFDAEDTLKVADFGIAKVLGGASTMATRAGYVLGTPAYIAPEQAQSAELSPATDVYAAGTVLFELLAGQLPYTTDDPVAALYQHVHEDARLLRSVVPDAPPELEAVTVRALQRDAGDRYGSAEDLGVAISEAAAAVWGPNWLDESGVLVAATGRLGRVTPTPTPTIDPVQPGRVTPPPSVPPPPVAPPRAAPPRPPRPPRTPRPPRPPRAPQNRTAVIAIAAVVVVLAIGGGVFALTGGGGKAKKGASSSTASPVLTPKQLVSRTSPAAISLSGRQGTGVFGGTGVVVDKDRGFVLTNAHVISGLSALKARMSNGTEVPVRVLGQAPCEDLAVVQLTDVPAGLVALPLGDSGALQAGDSVTALGYPTSFADPATQKVVVTTGVVQSPKVAAQPGASLPKLSSTIQHSATLNPGNSGGPLLNDRGEVVGINTLSNPDAKGQFYAISSNAVKQAFPDLSAGHNKGYAGWDLASFDEAYVADAFKQTGYGTPEEADAAEKYLSDKGIRGLLVFGVDVKSPAEDGHIEGGDFIEKINTVPVSSVTDVCDILLSASPGQTLVVEGEYLTKAGSHEAFTPWRADVKPA